MPLQHRRDDALHGAGISHIERDRLGATAIALNRFGHRARILSARRGNHDRPLAGHLLGDGVPDPTRRASDDGDAVRQINHTHSQGGRPPPPPPPPLPPPPPPPRLPPTPSREPLRRLAPFARLASLRSLASSCAAPCLAVAACSSETTY